MPKNKPCSSFATTKQPKSCGGEIDVAAHLDEVIVSACGYKPIWLPDLHARIDMAQTKYGQSLLTHDGRDGLVDLIQELDDAINYSVKVILEKDSRVSPALPDLLVALVTLTDCVYKAITNKSPATE